MSNKDPQKQLRILVRWALEAITGCDDLNSDAAHTADGITLTGLKKPWTRETLESLRADFRVISDAMGDSPIWNRGGQGWRAMRALKAALPAEPVRVEDARPFEGSVEEMRRFAVLAQEAAEKVVADLLGDTYDVSLVWQSYRIGGPRLAEVNYRKVLSPTTASWNFVLRADAYGDETVDFRVHLLVESWCVAHMNDDPDERDIVEGHLRDVLKEWTDAKP